MTNTEIFVVSLFIVLALSIVWTSLRVGITPVPSRRSVRLAMLDAAGSPDDGSRIIDLGSGWGSLVIPAARRFPRAQVVGYELSLLPYLVSVLLKYLFRLSNLRLVKRNFMTQDLAKAEVILCYLYPAGMQVLSEKLLSEQSAALVISNTFALHGIEASRVLRINDLYRSPVYIYQLNPDSTPKDTIHV